MSIDDYVTRGDERDAETFDWGEIVWLDSSDLTAGDGLTVGEVTFYPGAANDEHRHPNCEESLYVLAGELEHSLGDETTTLERGDLLHIPADVPHRARNVGDGEAVAIIAYDTGERSVQFTE